MKYSDFVAAVLWALQCKNGYASHLESEEMAHVRACFDNGISVDQCAHNLIMYDFSSCED